MLKLYREIFFFLESAMLKKNCQSFPSCVPQCQTLIACLSTALKNHKRGLSVNMRCRRYRNTYARLMKNPDIYALIEKNRDRVHLPLNDLESVRRIVNLNISVYALNEEKLTTECLFSTSHKNRPEVEIFAYRKGYALITQPSSFFKYYRCSHCLNSYRIKQVRDRHYLSCKALVKTDEKTAEVNWTASKAIYQPLVFLEDRFIKFGVPLPTDWNPYFMAFDIESTLPKLDDLDNSVSSRTLFRELQRHELVCICIVSNIPKYERKSFIKMNPDSTFLKDFVDYIYDAALAMRHALMCRHQNFLEKLDVRIYKNASAATYSTGLKLKENFLQAIGKLVLVAYNNNSYDNRVMSKAGFISELVEKFKMMPTACTRSNEKKLVGLKCSINSHRLTIQIGDMISYIGQPMTLETFAQSMLDKSVHKLHFPYKYLTDIGKLQSTVFPGYDYFQGFDNINELNREWLMHIRNKGFNTTESTAPLRGYEKYELLEKEFYQKHKVMWKMLEDYCFRDCDLLFEGSLIWKNKFMNLFGVYPFQRYSISSLSTSFFMEELSKYPDSRMNFLTLPSTKEVSDMLREACIGGISLTVDRLAYIGAHAQPHYAASERIAAIKHYDIVAFYLVRLFVFRLHNKLSFYTKII